MKQKRKSTALIAFLVGLVLVFSFGFLQLAIAENPPGTDICPSGLSERTLSDGTKTCCPPGQLEGGESGKCQLVNPAEDQLVSIDNFGDLAVRIINILLGIAGAVAVVFLVIGGFQYITSRGNEEGMESAKRTVLGAVIGIVIILLSYAIVVIINNAVTQGNI